MSIFWSTFAWPAGIGIPLFALLCYRWRSDLRTSIWRRLIAVLVFASALSPNFVVPHQDVGAYAAISLSSAAIKDPFLWWFVAIPIVGVAGLVFIPWTIWFKLTARKRTA